MEHSLAYQTSPLPGLLRALASLFPAALVTALLALFMAQLIAMRDVSNTGSDVTEATISMGEVERLRRRERERPLDLVIAPLPQPGQPYRGPMLVEILGSPPPPDIEKLDPLPGPLTGGKITLVIPIPPAPSMDLVTPAFAACFAEGEEEAVIRLLYDVGPDGGTRNIRLQTASNPCVAAYARCELSTWVQPTLAGETDRVAGFIIARDEMVTRGSTCAETATL